MCLGGPNFNPETAEPEYLKKIGFSEEDIKLVQEVLCFTYFGSHQFSVSQGGRGKVKWSDEGFSERILKRKLDNDGISLNKGEKLLLEE